MHGARVSQSDRFSTRLSAESVQGTVTITSIVIPCTGADFVEEALLSAHFARRFAPAAEEIVIVIDQPAEITCVTGLGRDH